MDSYSAIVTMTGIAPVVSGGGRGQKAAIEWRGRTFEARGTNRAAALDALRAQLEPEKIAADTEDKAVEQAVAVQAAERIVVREIEKADEHPAVRGTRSPRACDMSCLFAHINTCVCQCEGQNHKAGWLLFDLEQAFDGPKRKVGGRECACGCGEMTGGGHFKQGHDRKFHVGLEEKVDVDVYFRSEDGAGLVMTAAGKKALAKARG